MTYPSYESYKMSHTLILIYLNNVRNNKSKEKRNDHANVKNLCIHWFVVGEWCAEKILFPVEKPTSGQIVRFPFNFRF